MQWRIDR